MKIASKGNFFGPWNFAIASKWLCIFLLFSVAVRLEAKICFMHIPKTAGTTLRLMLEQQLSVDEIYPYRNRMQARGLVTQDLMSGHFPYWLCKKLDPDFEQTFKITILRDPVERYLSFLRAKKSQNKAFPDLESVIKQRLSSNPRYHLGLIDNALCRHLAENPLLEGEALLESAKQTLQSLDCVIFFDHFTEEVIALFQRLGVELQEKDVPKVNFTQKEPVSEPLLKEVRQLNELDLLLYEYAKTNLPKKATQYSLRTQSFDHLLKKANEIDYTFDFPLNGRGWSYRELTEESRFIFRWVMDQPAYIYFPLEEGHDYELYFAARPLTSEIFPRLKVNGQEIEVVQVDRGLFSLYHGKIPKDYITEEPTEISFYSTRSFLYKEIYPNGSDRNYPALSFSVNRIQLFTQ